MTMRETFWTDWGHKRQSTWAHERELPELLQKVVRTVERRYHYPSCNIFSADIHIYWSRLVHAFIAVQKNEIDEEVEWQICLINKYFSLSYSKTIFTLTASLNSTFLSFKRGTVMNQTMKLYNLGAKLFTTYINF